MEPDCKISIITSTHIANTILPIFYAKDDKRGISAKRILKEKYSGKETSVNQLVAVAITIEHDKDILASIAECLHQWAATHQDHTMRALDFKTKIIYLSTADIFRLLLMSRKICLF